MKQLQSVSEKKPLIISDANVSANIIPLHNLNSITLLLLTRKDFKVLWEVHGKSWVLNRFPIRISIELFDENVIQLFLPKVD